MQLDKRTRLIAFWCILALLIFARLYQFGLVPGDINQDEAFAGYNAYTLFHNGRDSFGYGMPVYLTAWGSGMNALESYLAIPFIALFGPHTWSLRLAPLILSILSLVTVYKLIHDFIKNDIFALFAMLFTGIMPWHIMLSRWALESNLAPAFLLFSCYFFLKGLEKEKYYIFAAVCYGLSLYSCATMWVVVPFIILAEVIYFILKKKIRLTKYTISAGIILILISLPAVLFLLVNMGYMDELKSGILSIPKLVGFRGGEVSFSNLSENLDNLFKIILNQNDGLIWNTTNEFGLIYKYSLPFSIVGLGAIIAPVILKNMKISSSESNYIIDKTDNTTETKENKSISLSFFLIVHLIAGLVIGALISVNVNRVNILWLPLILLTAYGIYFVFYKIKWIRDRLVWLPLVVYLFSFVRFESYYFTDYKNEINNNFCEGIEDALTFVKEDLADDQSVYIAPGLNYARVLYLTEQDLDEYLSTVEYTNYPSAFLDVRSFGRYSFDLNTETEPDNTSVYVVDDSFNDSYLVSRLYENGYNNYTSGKYTVFYRN